MYLIEKSDKKQLATKDRENIAIKRYTEIKELIIANSDVDFKDIIHEIAGISPGTYYNYIGNSEKKGRISYYTAKNMSNFFNLPLGVFDCTEEFTDEDKNKIATIIKARFKYIKDGSNATIQTNENLRQKINFLSKRENMTTDELLKKAIDEQVYYPFLRRSHLENYRTLHNKYIIKDLNDRDNYTKAFLYILASNGLYMEYADNELYQCIHNETPGTDNPATEITVNVNIPSELLWAINPSELYMGENIISLLELGVNLLFSKPYTSDSNSNNKFDIPKDYMLAEDLKLLCNAILISRGINSDLPKDRELYLLDYNSKLKEVAKENLTPEEFLKSSFVREYNQNLKFDIFINAINKLNMNYSISIRAENTAILHYKNDPQKRIACICTSYNSLIFYIINLEDCFFNPFYYTNKDEDIDLEYLLEFLFKRYEEITENFKPTRENNPQYSLKKSMKWLRYTGSLID